MKRLLAVLILLAATVGAQTFPPQEGSSGSRVLWFDFTGTTAAHFGSGAINSGNQAQIQGDETHPGVVQIGNNSTLNGGVYWQVGGETFLIAGGEVFEITFKLDASTDVVAYMGFQDSFTATAPTDGVYLNLAADQVDGVAVSNTTSSTTASNYILSTSTWYIGRVTLNANATLAMFSIYSESGSLLWVDTLTTNIPTAAGRNTGAGLTTYKTSIGDADFLSVDYMEATSPSLSAKGAGAGAGVNYGGGSGGGGGEGVWGSITGTLSDQTDLQSELTAKVDIPGSNGLIARIAPSTTTARTLTSSDGTLTVSNGDGQSGNPDFVVDTSVFSRFTQGTGGAPGTCSVGTFHIETDDTEMYYCDSTDSQTLVGGGTSLSQGTLAGRGAASGAGAAEEITVGTGLSMTTTTLSVSAPFDPMDLSQVWLREEFHGGDLSDSTIGELGWELRDQVGTGSMSALAVGYDTQGAVEVTSGATSGNSSAVTLGFKGSERTFGNLTENGAVWDAKFSFKFQETTTTAHYIGFNYTATSGPGLPPTRGFVIRADSTQSDTNFMLCNYYTTFNCQDSGVALDTSYHVFRVRKTDNGTVRMTLDSGTEYTFCASGCDVTTTLPPDTTDFGVAFLAGTRTSAARSVVAEAFAYYATGLSR